MILVEGDSEYILVDTIYRQMYEEKLEAQNIHVIAVGGTSFKGYLELAKLLEIKTAVIRDNDGDHQNNCVDNYSSYVSDSIEIFGDQDDKRKTLEICVYSDNKDFCNNLFSDKTTKSVQEYMLANKTDTALAIVQSAMNNFVCPSYIKKAFEWIRK